MPRWNPSSLLALGAQIPVSGGAPSSAGFPFSGGDPFSPARQRIVFIVPRARAPDPKTSVEDGIMWGLLIGAAVLIAAAACVFVYRQVASGKLDGRISLSIHAIIALAIMFGSFELQEFFNRCIEKTP